MNSELDQDLSLLNLVLHASVPVQLVMALLFWVATFVLLFSAFRDRENSSS